MPGGSSAFDKGGDRRSEDASRSPGRRAGTPAGLVGLQRRAGNRAVAGMLGGGAAIPVQRLVPTKPADLDRLISTMDSLKGVVGKTEGSKKDFAAIRKALASYRSAATKGTPNLGLLAERLSILDVLCTRFLTEHPDDRKRRVVIDRLSDEVAAERTVVSQGQAQNVYQANVASGRTSAAPGETDPGKKFGFQALSSFGKMGAMDHSVSMETGRAERIEAKKKQYGLTDAEISAITIFSAGDFSYINPATANSDSWMDSQKAGSDELKPFANKTLKEEGSLHSAVALKGLGKMEPYDGETYRGARFTPEEFAARFTLGSTTSFTSLASSSHDKDVALKFAHGLSSGGKPAADKTVAVINILTNSGGVDISDIALVKSEAEVLILPGSVFEVVSVEEVDGKTEYADKVQQAKDKGLNLPTKWYVCTLAPAKDKPKPKEEAPGWKSATPTPPEEGRPESFDLKPLVRNGRGRW